MWKRSEVFDCERFANDKIWRICYEFWETESEAAWLTKLQVCTAHDRIIWSKVTEVKKVFDLKLFGSWNCELWKITKDDKIIIWRNWNTFLIICQGDYLAVRMILFFTIYLYCKRFYKLNSEIWLKTYKDRRKASESRRRVVLKYL